MKLQIFSGKQNISLANGICYELGQVIGKVDHHTFPSGEIWCQYMENIRGGDIFIVEPISKPANDSLMRILIMADAARRASAARITAVIPYFGYSRQDRKDKSRVPISAKLVMDMLEASGVDRILTMDLHNPAIGGFTNIPVDHLYAIPIFLKGAAVLDPQRVVFVAPDAGAIKRTEEYANAIGASFAVCPKSRNRNGVFTHPVIGDVNGKIAVIIDDITESCNTLVGAAERCKEAGASKIHVCITHGLFTDQGYENIRNCSSIESVFVTNTVNVDPTKSHGKIISLNCAELFAKAIKSIHNDESVSELFKV